MYLRFSAALLLGDCRAERIAVKKRRLKLERIRMGLSDSQDSSSANEDAESEFDSGGDWGGDKEGGSAEVDEDNDETPTDRVARNMKVAANAYRGKDTLLDRILIGI